MEEGQAELGGSGHKPGNTGGPRELEEARKDPPLAPPEGARLAHTWFQPSETLSDIWNVRRVCVVLSL